VTYPAERVTIGVSRRAAHMRPVRLVVACFLLLSTLLTYAQTSDRTSSGDDGQAYLQWLEKSLASIQTIKVGMTRGDLLRLFEMDGGFQSTKVERYVYRQCPLLKVDVAFIPVSDTNDHLNDTIKSISKPYLESPFYD
jgi:hypothetical protein